jgi:multiple sugar transport system permease protein
MRLYQKKVKIDQVKVFSYLLIIVYLGFSLFPIAWTLSSSLKPEAEVENIPPTWIAESPTLENYSWVIKETPILMSIRNSLIMASGATALAAILGVPAAYGFSRFRFPGISFLFILILSSRIVAPTALLIPFVMIARTIGIADTHLAIILIDTYMWVPFLVWVMKSAFDAIPRELNDAAKIDGCSNIAVLTRVMMPLALPGLAAVLIMVFLMAWGDFIFPLALTYSVSVKPLTVQMTYFYTDVYTLYGGLTSAGIIGIIPTVFFAVVFQRYIVKGIMTGAVKG